MEIPHNTSVLCHRIHAAITQLTESKARFKTLRATARDEQCRFRQAMLSELNRLGVSSIQTSRYDKNSNPIFIVKKRCISSRTITNEMISKTINIVFNNDESDKWLTLDLSTLFEDFMSRINQHCLIPSDYVCIVNKLSSKTRGMCIQETELSISSRNILEELVHVEERLAQVDQQQKRISIPLIEEIREVEKSLLNILDGTPIRMSHYCIKKRTKKYTKKVNAKTIVPLIQEMLCSQIKTFKEVHVNSKPSFLNIQDWKKQISKQIFDMVKQQNMLNTISYDVIQVVNKK